MYERCDLRYSSRCSSRRGRLPGEAAPKLAPRETEVIRRACSVVQCIWRGACCNSMPLCLSTLTARVSNDSTSPYSTPLHSSPLHFARLRSTELAAMHDRHTIASPRRSHGGPQPTPVSSPRSPNPVVLRSACDDPLLQPRRGTRTRRPAVAAAVHDSVCAEQPDDVCLLVSRPLAPRTTQRREDASAALGLRPPAGALALLARRDAPACQLLHSFVCIPPQRQHAARHPRRRGRWPAGTLSRCTGPAPLRSARRTPS